MNETQGQTSVSKPFVNILDVCTTPMVVARGKIHRFVGRSPVEDLDRIGMRRS